VILYLDASALVKQYVREAGSEEMADAIAATDRYRVLATSILTGVEVPASVALACRMGRLSEEQERVVLVDFRHDLAGIHLVPVDLELVARAARLAHQHALRGYDSVHLASAVSLSEMLGEDVTFACFDRTLSRAARAAGLSPLPDDLQEWRAALGH